MRAPHLINPIEAMTMMLTGRNVRASRAQSLGLVDAVTQERHVRAAVNDAVTGKLKSRGGGVLVTAINSTLGRKIAASRMRSADRQEGAVEHYPAPYALIELWELHGGDKAATAQGRESPRSPGCWSPTPRSNLVRVFFLREKLKELAGRQQWSGKRVHVIGAGAMGGDIAAWCAWQGSASRSPT